MPIHIAILGAPGTGKASLAQTLIQEFSTRRELLKVIVSDCVPLRDTAFKVDLALLIGIDGAACSKNNVLNQQLRASLASGGWPFAVIYGETEARKQSALAVISHYLKQPIARSSQETIWTRACEGCADSQCEQKLFTRLL